MAGKNDKDLAVLFVCLGNICRSPMAEGAFRAAAEKAGLDATVDSVGTAGYHIGEPPDPRTIAVAQRHGVDISQARGRQISPDDFEKFTHIFALDIANLAGIEARCPRHFDGQLGLLLDVLEDRQGESVADPYYGGEREFDVAWEEISHAAEQLVEQLKSERTDSPD